MTITETPARICDCGSGPNVARCRADHRERTDCPHLSDGVKCGQRANVLKTAATLPAADRPGEPAGDDLASRWAAEEPPGAAPGSSLVVSQ